MAEVQESGPITGLAYTDDQWQAGHVAGVGIANDYDGDSFSITLPSGSDVATIGPGFAQVGGRGFWVPSGQAQDVPIPPSTNAVLGRTDVIVARYSESYPAALPGPVQIHVLSGVEGSGVRPNPDLGLQIGEGQVELPLWAVTRIADDTLAQASVVDLRMWKGQSLQIADECPFLPSAPLGSRATWRGRVYRRSTDGGTSSWVLESSPVETLTGTSATANASDTSIGETDAGWQRRSGCRMVRDGNWRWLHLESYKGGSGNLEASNIGGHSDQHLAGLHAQDRPPVLMSASARVQGLSGATYWGGAHITPGGGIYLNSWAPGITIGPSGPDPTVIIDATWRV